MLGTSTAQRGFETAILDEELDTVSFNLATSLQPLAGSYALLKDADKKNLQDKKHLNKTGGDVFTKEFAMTYNRLQEGEYVGALFTDNSSYLAEQEGE